MKHFTINQNIRIVATDHKYYLEFNDVTIPLGGSNEVDDLIDKLNAIQGGNLQSDEDAVEESISEADIQSEQDHKDWVINHRS